MEADDKNRMDELLNLPKHLGLSLFEEYIISFLERKEDKNLAIQELDRTIAELQNCLSSISLHIKQNYLLRQVQNEYSCNDEVFYTKQEIAIRYRVSIRTVSNWTYSGLHVTEIGGVKRISDRAVRAFVKTNKTKKFNWKSIAR